MSALFDQSTSLQHFPHPICVVRSKEGEVIPPPLADNLYAHLPEPKKLIEFEGCGHNSWPSAPQLGWWDNALDFIAPRKGT